MPPRRTDKKGYERSRMLRQEMTPAEIKLWARLRNHQLNGVKFRRQHAIGKYIVDFCTPRQHLIIELDGSQHLDQEEYDSARTDYLALLGYRVIRFDNHDVMNDIDRVLQAIDRAIEE